MGTSWKDILREHEKTRAKITCKLWNILSASVDTELNTDFIPYLQDATANIHWFYGPKGITITTSMYDYDLGEIEESIAIPIEWLDMPEEQLKKSMLDKKELQETQQLNQQYRMLKQNAEYLGYKLVKIEET